MAWIPDPPPPTPSTVTRSAEDVLASSELFDYAATSGCILADHIGHSELSDSISALHHTLSDTIADTEFEEFILTTPLTLSISENFHVTELWDTLPVDVTGLPYSVYAYSVWMTQGLAAYLALFCKKFIDLETAPVVGISSVEEWVSKSLAEKAQDMQDKQEAL